jgi:hypothetical protein
MYLKKFSKNKEFSEKLIDKLIISNFKIEYKKKKKNLFKEIKFSLIFTKMFILFYIYYLNLIFFEVKIKIICLFMTL